MSKNDQAAREAWQWVEDTDPSDISVENIHSAYRINVPLCKAGKCK